MAEVQWIKGELNPPSNNEYYIIIEAQEDTVSFKKGDIEITSDCFDVEQGCFDTIGKDNPCWKVLCWADMLRPNVPPKLRDKVKVFFGERVDENESNA